MIGGFCSQYVLTPVTESGHDRVHQCLNREPANQRRLIDLLTRATDGLVNRAAGFLSATLHLGLDGTKVTMHAQWASMEDYEAMRGDRGPLPFLQEALTFATFEPDSYEFVRDLSPIS